CTEGEYGNTLAYDTGPARSGVVCSTPDFRRRSARGGRSGRGDDERNSLGAHSGPRNVVHYGTRSTAAGHHCLVHLRNSTVHPYPPAAGRGGEGGRSA